MDERDNINEITGRLIRIETLLDQMVKTDCLERQLLEEKIKLLEEQIKVANKRIKDIEENQKWTWRTVVGALIVGAVGLLYKLK